MKNVVFGILLMCEFIFSVSYALEAQDIIMKANSRIKPIYDSTVYLEKKMSNQDFFPPIRILYIDHLYKYSIDINSLKQLAHSLPKSSTPYIIDIESWDVHTLNDEEANRNINKYILVIDTLRNERPDLKFGYYGVLPNRDYFAPITNDPKKLLEWKHINQRLTRLSKHVDVICPSLYTFFNDVSGWKKYAAENIKRAREYGKPVYPFIWPQYHDSSSFLLKGKFLPESFWYEELKLVYSMSDGVIIWGGVKDGVQMEWDENAIWWNITKNFIKYKITSKSADDLYTKDSNVAKRM